ncbi:leucine-rich repeat domain-containing protein [Stieleria maiorica]|uniref:leucine-rich repeat domain-containing protein n=1 Tax=Stieleria maiorica TaxID=2795974 RepID=UPI00142F2BDD|nr:hypothetical protein [Stieleria maiorica]
MSHFTRIGLPRVLPRRFQLRTLLLIVLVVAVFFAWIGKDLIRSRLQRSIVESIEASGGQVFFDYQKSSSSGFTAYLRDAQPHGSRVIRALFGEDLYAKASCVVFLDPQTVDGDIARLGELPDLSEVMISGVGVTDESVQSILRIRRLRSLSLTHTSVSPQGLAGLQAARTLQHLTLAGSSATDKHLETLSEFHALDSIQVIDSPITDDGLRSLGGLHRLKRLDIYRCKTISNAGVSELGRLEDLERLHLLQSNISDASLEILVRLRRLRELRLDGKITDVGFGHLGNLQEMEYLDLHDTGVGDLSLATIARFRRLKSLDLWGTQISDEGLRLISNLPELEHLNIAFTKVTGAGLEHLADMSSLASVSVQIDHSVTLDRVKALKTKLPDCAISCWTQNPDGSQQCSRTL